MNHPQVLRAMFPLQMPRQIKRVCEGEFFALPKNAVPDLSVLLKTHEPAQAFWLEYHKTFFEVMRSSWANVRH